MLIKVSVLQKAALNNFLHVKTIEEIARQTTNGKITTIPGSCLSKLYFSGRRGKKMSCLTYDIVTNRGKTLTDQVSLSFK